MRRLVLATIAALALLLGASALAAAEGERLGVPSPESTPSAGADAGMGMGTADASSDPAGTDAATDPSAEGVVPGSIEPPCESAAVMLADDPATVAALAVDIPKSRQWWTNLLKAKFDEAPNIGDEYKGKFGADVTVTYSDGTTCTYKGKVRLAGDWKDHISVDGLQPRSTMDIALSDGNVDGIVRFKLLLPETRGGDTEIVNGEIYRELGFVAPRSQRLPVAVNGVTAPMIMQENVAKEMLEDNRLRESAMLETDESLLWASRADTSAADKQRESALLFARIANTKWAQAGEPQSAIAQQGLELLNRAVSADWLGNPVQLSPSLVSNDSEVAALNRRFQVLSVATGGGHGLYNHNRRAYYDPMIGGLVPIYYDGGTDLLNPAWQTQPLNPADPREANRLEDVAPEDAAVVRSRLEAIDPAAFTARVRAVGADVDEAQVRAVLAAVIRNTGAIEATTAPVDAPSWRTDPHRDVAQPLKLVFGTTKSGFTVCEKDLSGCAALPLNEAQVGMLWEGRLEFDGVEHAYAGPSKDAYAAGTDPGEPSADPLRLVAPVGDGAVLVAGNPEVAIDEDARTITGVLRSETDRVVVQGGEWDGWTIGVRTETTAARESTTRIDSRLLTGCLTILDAELVDAVVTSAGGLCEDGVNLVRATGTIAQLTVTDADQDAIDMDFSDVLVRNVEVARAGNDCLDLSGGNYAVGMLNATDCTDKGVSIGERSRAAIDDATINGAESGLVVKDSSVLTVKTGSLTGVNACFSAYRKKQEFGGAVLRVGESVTCDGTVDHIQPGSVLERTP